MGIALPVFPKQTVQFVMAAGGYQTQTEDSLVPCLQCTDFLPGRRFQIQHFHGIAVESASRFRRHHLTGASFKEKGAQLLFQKVHLAGQRRLGNMKLSGGSRNGALFYNGFKISQLS